MMAHLCYFIIHLRGTNLRLRACLRVAFLRGFEGEDFGGLSLYIDIYSRFNKIEGMP
jgi:hypothetical protein